MVPVGSGARITYAEREDYVGRELVQKDQTGRPVMSIRTERPDGSNDTVVLAPTVNAGIGAHHAKVITRRPHRGTPTSGQR
jgi:hypothetical protein